MKVIAARSLVALAIVGMLAVGAPVVASAKITISAARPPSNTVMRFSSSVRVIK